MTWSVYRVRGTNVAHVMPDDDLREHSEVDCECGPRMVQVLTAPYAWVITHNSLDGRESKE